MRPVHPVLNQTKPDIIYLYLLTNVCKMFLASSEVRGGYDFYLRINETSGMYSTFLDFQKGNDPF